MLEKALDETAHASLEGAISRSDLMQAIQSLEVHGREGKASGR